jgi:mRNA interferase RelE/StbE
MPADTARTIQGKIMQLAKEPEALANNISKLRGRKGYRLRIGDWRVIFEMDEKQLSVLEIGPRATIYR